MDCPHCVGEPVNVDQVFRDQEFEGRTRMLISEGRDLLTLINVFEGYDGSNSGIFFCTVVGWQPRQRLAQIRERRTIIRSPVAGWITLVAS